jgi:hypothetical protein
MSDATSGLVRLGRLMEMAGIASSFRAGAAGTDAKKWSSKGSSGGGGATASAAVAGTSPGRFDTRRVGGEGVTRVSSDDLAEVFDPVGFNGEWTLSEVERVTRALPELQLPFDGTSIVPAIEALDGAIFESHASNTTSALVDADVAQENGGFAS